MKPQISVAICTWNRCASLEQTLAQLTRTENSSDSAWEVVVVNNASTDETSSVVSSFKDRLPIREVREPRSGVSHARNRALAEVSGTHIAFIDDDVHVGAEWLVTLRRLALAYSRAAIFAGPVRPRFVVEPAPDLLAAFPYLRKGFCALDYDQPEGTLRNGALPAGANMAFRRAAIAGLQFAIDLGPRDGSLEGHEDVDFVRRVYARGGVAVWSPDLVVDHVVDPSRVTVEYLIQLERDRARTRIRSLQSSRGPTIFGVPPFVLGGWVVSHAIHAVCRATPAKEQQLIWRVRCERYRAKFQEYRAIARTPVQ